MSKHFCMCVGMWACDRMPLLKRPANDDGKIMISNLLGKSITKKKCSLFMLINKMEISLKRSLFAKFKI